MPSTATSILDGLSTSVAVKAPCRTVATSNITLAGLQTISGYTTVENDRVLVTGQTNPVDNGIYMASTGNWTRAKDADGTRDLVQGTIVLVRSSVADGAIYELTAANPIVVGTSSLTFDLRDDPAVTYGQTAAELAALVTPTNTSIQPQNPLPKRYGAAGDGTTDDTAELATTDSANGFAMIDGGGFTYSVSSTLPASPLPAGFNFYNGRILCDETVSDTLDGYSVTLFGYGAGAANTFIPEQHAAGGGIFYASGNHIVAIGRNALSLNTTGRRMTAVGSKALGANTTGAYNTGIGSHALQDNTIGDENTAVGVQSLQKNTTGDNNAAFGTGAALLNQTGSLNAALGDHALRDSVTGDHNVAVGAQAMLAANGASDNVAVGYQSLSAALTGNYNTAVGAATLGNVTSGTNNVAVGRRALSANTASENTAVGADAAVSVTSATAIVAVGRNALSSLTTAINCTAVGHAALAACTGTNNTAVGRAAANATTTGTGNTAIGQQALASNIDGINNTAIGNSADSAATTFDNCTCIGNGSASSADNQVTLGNASIATLRCQQTTITALSDRRFKRNIRPFDLPDAFLDEVEIVVYEWNEDDMPQGPQVGVIAQQLDELQKRYGVEWLGLVDKSNPDRWEATPGKILFYLVQRVQQQSRTLRSLEDRVAALEAIVVP